MAIQLREDISETVRTPRKVRVTEKYVHPETKWESTQHVGVYVEGWFLFPLVKGKKNQRIPLVLSHFDQIATRRGHEPVIVTDLLRGEQYRIESAPCGLGCHCDATAEKV